MFKCNTSIAARLSPDALQALIGGQKLNPHKRLRKLRRKAVATITVTDVKALLKAKGIGRPTQGQVNRILDGEKVFIKRGKSTFKVAANAARTKIYVWRLP